MLRVIPEVISLLVLKIISVLFGISFCALVVAIANIRLALLISISICAVLLHAIFGGELRKQFKLVGLPVYFVIFNIT